MKHTRGEREPLAVTRVVKPLVEPRRNSAFLCREAVLNGECPVRPVAGATSHPPFPIGYTLFHSSAHLLPHSRIDIRPAGKSEDASLVSSTLNPHWPNRSKNPPVNSAIILSSACIDHRPCQTPTSNHLSAVHSTARSHRRRNTICSRLHPTAHTRMHRTDHTHRRHQGSTINFARWRTSRMTIGTNRLMSAPILTATARGGVSCTGPSQRCSSGTRTAGWTTSG